MTETRTAPSALWSRLVVSAALCWLVPACSEPAPAPAAAPAPSAPSTQAAPKLSPAAEAAGSAKPVTETPQADTSAAKPSQPAAVAAQAPSAAPPKLSPDQMCDGICARASELRCEKARECPKMCAETMQLHVCEQELEVATRCTLSHPARDWQCTSQGVASIKDPFCTEEQRAFGKCLIANSPQR